MASTTRKSSARKATPRRRRTTEPTAADVRSHRARQASVAAILDQVFGPFTEMNPHLWERRAYLLLVGSVYERLATDEEVSTDELVKLARVLAEHRRLKAATPDAGDETAGADDAASDNGRLPDRVADLVRDLYGTAACPHTIEDEKSGGAGG